MDPHNHNILTLGAFAILAVVGISLFASSANVGANFIILPGPEDLWSQQKGTPLLGAKIEAYNHAMILSKQSAKECSKQANAEKCCEDLCVKGCGALDKLCQKRCPPSCIYLSKTQIMQTSQLGYVDKR